MDFVNPITFRGSRFTKEIHSNWWMVFPSKIPISNTCSSFFKPWIFFVYYSRLKKRQSVYKVFNLSWLWFGIVLFLYASYLCSSDQIKNNKSRNHGPMKRYLLMFEWKAIEHIIKLEHCEYKPFLPFSFFSCSSSCSPTAKVFH